MSPEMQRSLGQIGALESVLLGAAVIPVLMLGAILIFVSMIINLAGMALVNLSVWAVGGKKP
jgi:hypothetical protein